MLEQLIRMNQFAVAFIVIFPIVIISLIALLKVKFSKIFGKDSGILSMVISIIGWSSFILWAVAVAGLVKQSMQNCVPRGVVEETQFKNQVNHVKDSVQGIKQ